MTEHQDSGPSAEEARQALESGARCGTPPDVRGIQRGYPCADPAADLLDPFAEVGEAEFGVLRDALKLSDSVLSKHVKVLEQAGFVTVRKGSVNGRTRTWVALNKTGQKAFKAHIEELRKLAAAGDLLDP